MSQVEPNPNRRSESLWTRNFLRKNPRKQKKQGDNKRKTQKGAISNLVRKGTFLSWFDSGVSVALTNPAR